MWPKFCTIYFEFGKLQKYKNHSIRENSQNLVALSKVGFATYVHHLMSGKDRIR
jgi:hypothetical protein